MQELEHFLSAQKNSYPIALAEIKSGRKQSHWMWYIFPQLAGLGHSEMASRYAIRDLEQAHCYLSHPILGKRLLEISRAAHSSPATDAAALMGSPDEFKLWSCMTLFSLVPRADPIFEKVLERFFDAAPDARTLELIG